ncbi:MAG: GxxExxY protein [Chloroflexota bacterium]
MNENDLSKIIVDSAIEVHRTFGGPGLLENVYRDGMIIEIRRRGILVEKEQLVPIVYKGETISTPLKLDLLVGNLVIVECKAVSTPHPIFEAQLLTYLRLTKLKLGLLINFGQRYVKNGIVRVVNGLEEDGFKTYKKQ